MLKLFATSILSMTFISLLSSASMAGWKEELKKAKAKSEQVVRSIQDPHGPDAKKILPADVRHTLQDPKKQINELCISAGNALVSLGSLLQKGQQTNNASPDDCE